MKRHDLERLLEEARRRGWLVEHTRSGHMRLRHPNGSQLFCPTTPSDPRTLLNVKADLKRAERAR
jgi:predicted RNA binding protein YcfA (HicA-like mRNA interferase family)